ncbi:hypothetical protein N802_11450 [Knoellia sinensis KCTC 19936]|uniref:DUF305 domain-containing protein n=1 Tax=Knoellia sinensis KCTC 19936 TaxID=1385520 RepID=A0A0A0IZ43_9MICO|nr:DUF305 domain-containing protein [Knoellia sinensis]KGN29759.1 hypothetical protein N802_11450 [Knoellia sinensis KCTC 19936]
MKRITRVLVVSALAAATLSACTDNGDHDMSTMSSTSPGSATTSPSGTSASGAHNDADVKFATGMIPHHAQAVSMAAMVPTRASSQEVKDLAKQIQAAQDPEITQMTGWLQAWGAPVPAATGMQHGGDGMMSMDEMSQLGSATGTDFDRMWLQMMIKHHQGAITMARTELADGADADAKALAQAIIDGQSDEIATMTALLTGD